MKKIKKILTGTLISAISITAIGCGSTNNKLAKNIDKSMADFVTCINNLDYVDTTKPSSEKVGKIVETNAGISPFVMKKRRLSGINQINNSQDSLTYLNEKLSENDIENTITRPTDRSGDFSLFILSDVPFITLTSEDNTTNLNLNLKFSTNKIEEKSTEIDSKINTLILKRSILMIYVNEIYNGNVNFSDESKVAINAYLNVIKENTSYLNGNRGMVRNQLSLASDLVQNEKNDDLVNYYIIKSGEALETRASKLDSTISAIDSIIKIIEDNLSSSSSYYNVKLSGTYEEIISNIQSETNGEVGEITNNSTNQEIANSILNSLKLTKESFTNSQDEIEHNQTTQNSDNTINNNSNNTTTNIGNDNSNTDLATNNNTSLNTTNNTANTITNQSNTNSNTINGTNISNTNNALTNTTNRNLTNTNNNSINATNNPIYNGTTYSTKTNNVNSNVFTPVTNNSPTNNSLTANTSNNQNASLVQDNNLNSGLKINNGTNLNNSNSKVTNNANQNQTIRNNSINQSRNNNTISRNQTTISNNTTTSNINNVNNNLKSSTNITNNPNTNNQSNNGVSNSNNTTINRRVVRQNESNNTTTSTNNINNSVTRNNGLNTTRNVNNKNSNTSQVNQSNNQNNLQNNIMTTEYYPHRTKDIKDEDIIRENRATLQNNTANSTKTNNTNNRIINQNLKNN